MKKVKSGLAVFIVILLAAGAAFVGGILFQNRNGEAESEPEIKIDVIEQEIQEIAEYAVLNYRYTNIGKFENNLNVYGWDVPLTTKNFLITYDGAMKLGIDSKAVNLNVVGKEIQIQIPPIKILSHEIKEDTIEVLDQSQNIINQIKIEDYATFAVDQKSSMEEKAKQNGLFTEAKEKVESQYRLFLENLPEIKDNYSVKFTASNDA